MTSRRSFDWPPLVGFAVFLLVLAAIGFGIWYEHKHPCVRVREYACEHTRCVFQDPTTNVCLSWTTSHDTCTECLERKP